MPELKLRPPGYGERALNKERFPASLRMTSCVDSAKKRPGTDGRPYRPVKQRLRGDRISRRDDFIVEAAGGDDEEQGAHGKKGERIGPKVNPGGAAENDAAGDVDEVSGGDKVADDVEELRHGFAGENVAGEKDAGEDSEKSELHGMSLRRSFAGDENAEGERDEKIRKGEEREKKNAAMDRDREEEAHGSDNHAQLEETDAEIREKLAEKQAHGANGSDKELLESASFFFADNGEGGKEGGDIEKKNGGESGEKEIGGAGIRIEEDLGAHIDGEGTAIGTSKDTAQGFVEADGGADIDGLAGDGGIRAINEHEDLPGHAMEQLVGIVDGNLDADAALAGDDGVVEIVIIVDIAVDVEGVGVPEAVEEFAGFAAPVGVVDDGVDLADVGVDAVAEKKHLHDGNDQGEEESGEVAADMKRFLIEDGAETTKRIKHWEPPARQLDRTVWLDGGM